jgi:DNA-binding HxlR family transcriptional regulator
MGIDELDEQVCPVARAIALVGDSWTLMVLRELFLGVRRFEEIRGHTGMSPQLLSRRLRELTDAGVVKRRPYQDRPKRFEFVLTEKGLDFWPVVVALRGWGERWATNEFRKPLITLTHRDCGHVVEPAVTCPECAEPLHARAVSAQMSKAMVRDRAARRAKYHQGSKPRGA